MDGSVKGIGIRLPVREILLFFYILLSRRRLKPFWINLLILERFPNVIVLLFTLVSNGLFSWLEMTERLKEKLEEFFGCEYELCIEFTGLIRLIF